MSKSIAPSILILFTVCATALAGGAVLADEGRLPQLSQVQARAVDSIVKAPATKQLGIEGVEVLNAESMEWSVLLLGKSSKTSGHADLHREAFGAIRTVNLDLGGSELQLTVDKEARQLRVSTGSSIGEARFDSRLNRWILDSEGEQIFESKADLLKLAAVLLLADEERFRPVAGASMGKGSTTPPPSGESIGWDRPPCVNCSGPEERGSSVSWTRSACCEAAAQNAHVACSNYWCLGCCNIGYCDAVCIPNLGDYFCACGVTGNSCTWDDRNC